VQRSSEKFLYTTGIVTPGLGAGVIPRLSQGVPTCSLEQLKMKNLAGPKMKHL